MQSRNKSYICCPEVYGNVQTIEILLYINLAMVYLRAHACPMDISLRLQQLLLPSSCDQTYTNIVIFIRGFQL
jgi:hypothetical protein